MQIKLPEPFTFEAGNRAVLLLHGFTGHSADVRMLGRYLEKKGYTTHAPIYKGHGQPPEELVKTTPEDWWKSAKEGFEHLRDLGYEEIAIAGLSLGGALGLKLTYTNQVKGITTMCTPMFFDNEEQLTKSFKQFVREFKQLEKKSEETIEQEMNELLDDSTQTFKELGKLIKEVHDEVDTIYAPTLVIQAEQDEVINTDSANYIYDQVETDHKDIKWYKESGHAITLDKERDQLHEDIYNFLESLDWTVE
ncbi:MULTISPECIES: alpha/beta hydrolase [Pontibacillus]|uniref:Alpha/beta fold hydrolase n=1 Tax=Pontibacillus chungwhensis TaxID=265426 RepID=A0ABY8V3N9_9BACI|nr:MULTISPECIES: alpha/beta fold hydrolase [Pontibacillus]MCD5325257.1 alpha/beta fold hydrolase [Pontibacillus sp. HN14]WIG00249.1 alpha/beta fold hydrolase [Pontibacillus chungwhensis]